MTGTTNTYNNASNNCNLIQIETPARAGLLGNPSDGFFGKTIAIPVRNFCAKIIMFEWDRIEILPGQTDNIKFNNLHEMIEDIAINGYYGGFRLIKAAIKKFNDYCLDHGIYLPDRKFTIRYASTIPRQVGLAGSSAIITSTFKALSEFYSVPIKNELMANYILWAETKELGISAGLQDRVVQTYNTPIFMDFNKEQMDKFGYGKYEPFSASILPPLYLAFQTNLTHVSTIHNDIRARWEKGEQKVIDTMEALANNASDGMDALKEQNWEKFDLCINRNFDLRASIYPIAEKNRQMIELARSIGATSKFPGSGGAIIGTYKNEQIFKHLVQKFELIGCKVQKILL
jgi:glucuronokinase